MQVRDRLFTKLKKLEAKKRKLLDSHSSKKYELFLQNLEDLDFQNRTRKFWTEVSTIRNAKNKEGYGVVKNSEGVVSKNREEFLEFWAHFWENLYSEKQVDSNYVPLSKYEICQYDPTDINHEPSIAELESVLKTISKNKAPGIDMVLVEEITSLINTPALIYLHELILIFWHLEKVPEALKTMILVPLIKDSDQDCSDPSNFRPIALMSNLLKIYQSIINSRISKMLESKLSLADTQFGFRPNRNILDAHLVFNDVVSARSKMVGPRGGRFAKAPLYVAYLDIKKAFDSVPRTILFRKLYSAGIRGKILRIIMDQFSGVKGLCKIDDLMTREFDIASGVVQGSRLGPILFNVFINDLLCELHNSDIGITLKCGKIVSGIAYADDLALFGKSPKELQKLISICEKWSRNNGLYFSPQKCKIQVFNSRKNSKCHKQPTFILYGKKLESVPYFKYLGILLQNSKNPYGRFIDIQLEKAENRLGVVRLLGFHKDGLRISTGVKLYKLLIRPILEFGAQIITYSKTHISRLERFQAKALRSLLGLRRNVKCETVRLLSGVEPICARFDLYKLKYFHKLRICDSATILHQILKEHIEVTSLVNCFQLQNKKLSEDFSASAEGFGGEMCNLFIKYKLKHEFQISTEQSYNEFGNFIKKRVLESALKDDLEAFKGVVSQSFVFKKAALPLLQNSKPYSGVFLNSLLFCDKDREVRTLVLRCLSGSHFASEEFCVEFKLQNQKARKKCTCCPFCSSSNRSLSHFINYCPKFMPSRITLQSSLIKAKIEPPNDLMDIFSLFFIPFNINIPDQVIALRDISDIWATFLMGIKSGFATNV